MHCKDVAVREVDCPLTVESIGCLMQHWRAYQRAEYLVLQHECQTAVVRLEKAQAGGLIRPVTGYEIVSLPDETVCIDRPTVNVLDIPALAAVQMEFPGLAVVVRGLFNHVSFVKGLRPLCLRVVDAVPPSPSKLSYLVRTALASGYVEKPVVPEEHDLDIPTLAQRAETPAVMFPCRASGLTADRPYYFLEAAPQVKEPVTLVGCRLSRRIYAELYGSDVPFIDICPRDLAPRDGVKTLVRCCGVKSGHERDGNLAAVPWGATVPEVVDAINDLFRDSE